MYTKNKVGLVGKLMFAFFLTLSNAVLATPPNDPDILLDLREKSDITIVVQGSISPTIPKLSKVTYENFNKILAINVIKDTNLNDSGSARRVDNHGREPNYCTISINDTSFIFNDYSHRNPFIGMGFNLENVENFIYLHELAHCNDGVMNPSGVDNMEWKEALADAYAVTILLDSKAIYATSVMPLIKYRTINKAPGSVLILKQVLEFYNTEVKGQKLTPNEILNRVKELRKRTFIKV